MDNINGLSCFSQTVGLKKLCKVKWLQGDYHVDWIKAFKLSKRFALAFKFTTVGCNVRAKKNKIKIILLNFDTN